MNKTQVEYITFFFFFNNFKIKKLIWFLHFFKKKFDKFLFISGVEYRWRTADIGQNSSFICEIPLTQIYKIVEENRDFGRWFFFHLWHLATSCRNSICFQTKWVRICQIKDCPYSVPIFLLTLLLPLPKSVTKICTVLL